MTGPERGFLLLTSHLGDPERRVLTVPQLRNLAQRVKNSEAPEEDRDLTEKDLRQLGYGEEMARRILELLGETDRLDHYLARGKREGCSPITRASGEYPTAWKHRLGLEAPGCIWAKGEVQLLQTPAIALVGSRELRRENREFAVAVGTYAAEHGWTLVSGNARGADKTAQEACLAAGGKVISIVADELNKHPQRSGVLYLSENGFGETFSAQRALSRNRCIHALGQLVFVAQADFKKGGTWQGTAANLRHGWSPVLCFRDGSEASLALEQMGAYLITADTLVDFELPEQDQITMF